MNETFIVQFHNVDRSEVVEQCALDDMKKLCRYNNEISGGRLTIKRAHRHHQGNVYHMTMELHVPGGDIVVTTDTEENHAHEDINVALCDTFRAARRQLQDFIRKRNSKNVQHQQKRLDITL